MRRMTTRQTKKIEKESINILFDVTYIQESLSCYIYIKNWNISKFEGGER